MSNKNESAKEEKELIVAESLEKDDSVKNETEENKKTTNKKVANEKIAKEKAASENKGNSNGVVYFLLLLTIAGVIAAGYYLWDIQQKQINALKQQKNSISELSSQLLQIKQIEQSNKNNTIQIADQALQLQQLSEQILQTKVISQQAIEIVNRSQKEWALAEIDYLLRIAHRRIEVARDIKGAIAALKGADARIEELADLNLFEVRKQLAKDIGSLNALHQADINGISLMIDQAIRYLPELPFNSVKEEIKVQLPETDMAEDASVQVQQQTFVDSVLETVKQIGEIKVHQRSIKVASGAEQQTEIEQLLRTYLLSARLAALRYDQTQFLQEVQKATEMLHIHYDEKDNRVQQLMNTLSGYSALQLNPDLPELTKAWDMLQKHMNKMKPGSKQEPVK